MINYLERCVTVHWRAMMASSLLAVFGLIFTYIQQSGYIADQWEAVNGLAVLPAPDDLTRLFASDVQAISPQQSVSQVGLAVTNTLPAILALFFLGCRIGASDFETRMAPTEVARDGRRSYMLGRAGLTAVLGAGMAILLLVVAFVMATWGISRVPQQIAQVVQRESPSVGTLLTGAAVACVVAAMHAVFGFCIAVMLRQSAAALGVGVALYLIQVALVRAAAPQHFVWLPLSAQWDLGQRHFALAGGQVQIPDMASAPFAPASILLVAGFLTVSSAVAWLRFREVAL